MLTKLLPNLEELSLTVMDNASYHSGETSSTELDKGQDNCLSAREFSFQRELLKLNYHISQQPMGPKEGGNFSNMEKLYTAYIKDNERDMGSRDIYRKQGSCVDPLYY